MASLLQPSLGSLRHLRWYDLTGSSNTVPAPLHRMACASWTSSYATPLSSASFTMGILLHSSSNLCAGQNNISFLIQGAPECCHHYIIVLHRQKWIYFCNVYVSLWESEIIASSLWVRVNWGTEYNIKCSHCLWVPLWDTQGLFCQSSWHCAVFPKVSDVLWTSVHAAWRNIGQRIGKTRECLSWAPRKWVCN